MSESAFNEAADFLYEKGFSIIPIQKGEKYPVERKTFPWGAVQMLPMKNWQRFNKVRATPEEIAEWKTWGDVGIGVLLGELSGIVGLDLDNDTDGLHEKILALVPDSPVKKKGAKGFTAFYKYNGDIPSKLSWSKDAIRIAEVLSNGQQCLTPPTFHPAGMNYVWLGPRLGEAELPELTLEHTRAIQALFPIEKPIHNIVPFTPGSARAQTDLPIDDMMRYLDAESYDSWVQVGMSLKTEYGEAGRNLYHQFSSQSTKYNPRDTDVKFNSFKRTDRTIGSLIYEAKQSGYVFSPRQEVAAVEILEGGNLRPIIHKEIIKHAEDIPEHLLDAPGLIGEVMKYILDTSMFPQPVLALAAAISFVGMLMGHRVKTDSNLRSNVYILSMAPSGAGKDHARQCIDEMLTACGLRNLLIGTPKSDSAVYKAMKRNKGRALMMTDEIGRFFKTVTSQKAGSYQQAITTAMLGMYNAAGRDYTGDEYANNADQGGRADISQPCLCIYGTSVKESVFQAFTSQETNDGFLARWLLFETERYDIDVLDKYFGEPPESLITQILAWEQHPTNANPQGNLQELDIVPTVVPFTDDAKEMITRYRRECRVKADKVRKSSQLGDALWNRAAEHAAKFSLIGHRHGQPIDVTEMKWGIELANNRVEYMIGAIGDNISDNQQEAMLKKVFAIIKKEGAKGITKSTLTTKTQGLKRVERNELIETLLDMGQIVTFDMQAKKRPVKGYRVNLGE